MFSPGTVIRRKRFLYRRTRDYKEIFNRKAVVLVRDVGKTRIRATIVEHPNKNWLGYTWTLESKYFEPIPGKGNEWQYWLEPGDLFMPARAIHISKMSKWHLRNAIKRINSADSSYWQRSKIISLEKALAKREKR